MPGPDAPAPLAVDRRLGGRYRLVGPIARGGMAEVWEGHDEVLSRPVAVKVLLSHLATDGVVRERFRREAVTAARLAHPNVVATYDTGLDHGVAYIVMELVRGQTLRHLLANRGALPVPVAVAVADQIADALAQAHAAGLVHRDIKPANVLMTEDVGTRPRIKVTDFGIAKAAEAVGADLTSTGMVLGTPKYLSPEQVEGREPDARADLYSLGVVLFEMLTGRPPFAGPTEMATALSHLRDHAPPASTVRAGIPPALDGVVATLLEKDPARRYPSADDLRGALARAAPGAVGDPSVDVAAPRHRLLAGAVAGPAISGPVGSGAAPVDVWDDGGTIRWSRSPVASDPVVTGGRPPVAADTTRATRPEPDRRAPVLPARRRGPGLVVGAVVVAGAVIGALSLARPTSSGDESASTPTGLPLTGARVFVLAPHSADDPQGAANVLDGNPATVWRTDLYGNAHFGNLYPGIGLAISVAGSHVLHRLAVVAPTGGWSAETFVSTTLPTDTTSVAVWGSPTSSATATGTTTTFALGGRTGSWVLLWLTSTGGPPFRTAIADVRVS